MPLAGRDRRTFSHSFGISHFYSHAPRGARPPLVKCGYLKEKFLLTCPSRGATSLTAASDNSFTISTHMPLAGRDQLIRRLRQRQQISTHMPLAGRDNTLGSLEEFYGYFYSHAPRGARPLHLAHAASAPVTYWGGPGFSLVYRAHGGPFRAKNRIFSGEPPGISQL